MWEKTGACPRRESWPVNLLPFRDTATGLASWYEMVGGGVGGVAVR